MGQTRADICFLGFKKYPRGAGAIGGSKNGVIVAHGYNIRLDSETGVQSTVRANL